MRQVALLRAADELHRGRTLSDECWQEIRSHLTDEQSIELCMLIGHYEMLAMTLNALQVEPDDFGARVPKLLRRLEARRARS